MRTLARSEIGDVGDVLRAEMCWAIFCGMDEERPESKVHAEHDLSLMPFGDEVDATLIDEMLSLKISDRLRTLTRYVNALGRFRRV